MGQGGGRSTNRRYQNGVPGNKKPNFNQGGRAKQILFLGAGESGKSTIIKQALVNYGSGFDDNTRNNYKNIIVQNLVKGAKAVFEAAPTIGYDIEDTDALTAGKKLVLRAKTVVTASTEKLELDDQIVANLRAIWNDESVQKALLESYKFQIDDTWPLFMKKLDGYPNWGGSEWSPSDEDIIACRNMTIGFSLIDVTVSDQKFRFIDVGGQRSERKKWMNLFNKVDAVIFVSALSEFNQKLYEERSVNRLYESVTLFRKYSAQQEFAESSLILFLNKYDLFIEKYYEQGQLLTKPFEDENIVDPPTKDQEADDNCMVALNWFADLYLHYCSRPSSEVFIHVTTALDKGNVKFVLESTKNYIFTNILQGTGMVGAMRNLNFSRLTE